MALDYLEAFQEVLALFFLMAVGYVLGKIKSFSVLDVAHIRRALYLICIPAMQFKEIATHEMNYELWKPFINSLLTTITMHVIFGLICLVYPFHNKIGTYLDGIFSFVYVSFVFFGCPLVRILYGQEYQYYPVMAGIVPFVIVPPIHSLMILLRQKADRKLEEENSHEEENPEIHHHEEEQEIELEGVEGLPDENEQHDTERKSDDDAENPEKEESVPPLWKTILWTILTPMLVLTLIGTIWSSTGIELPSFINSCTDYLERASMTTGLFTIGVFMSEHPFTGCNWIVLIINLCIHFIVMPLVSAFWSWLLGYDNQTTQICALLHALPIGLNGYVMAMNYGRGMHVSSFTFFYSNLLLIPIFMIWVAVFNETGFFAA